jgi:hypothetical protein
VLSDGSTYDITFVSHVGNTWTYHVEEISGKDLSHWSLGIGTCLDHIVEFSPPGAEIGADGSTDGFMGIKWNTPEAFSSGEFSFTLDGDYPEGTVEALAKAGSTYATGDILGPVCACPTGAVSDVLLYDVDANPAPSPVQRAAPVAAAGAAATTGLASIAWWLIRRKLLSL